MTGLRIQSQPRLAKSQLKGYSDLAVLVDENTLHHCYGRVKDQLPGHTLIVVPPGEAFKNLTTCIKVWQEMTDAGIDRHGALIAIGGGVIGDLGGFCASTFKRGIDSILLPTTLLSMVDASVGGKTGVDFGPFKNLIGTFAPPRSIVICTDFLHTLPGTELRSGFAEIVKHALISDRGLWNKIRRKTLGKQDLRKLVHHSVAFKSRVVKRDPREDGLRKILNYGHTVGHAIEGLAMMTGAPVLHGEAIAAGMVIEGHIALQKKLLSEPELNQISIYIYDVFGRIPIPPVEELLPGIIQDKKNKSKKILMALPKGIGKAVFDIAVNEQEIRTGISYYRSYT